MELSSGWSGTDDLPLITQSIPGIGGQIESPEDFQVREIPAYEPSGAGEHLFLRIEKRDLSTPDLLQRLSRLLGVKVGEIGCAGLKDRWAVTEQTISIPSKFESEVTKIEEPDFRILSSVRHTSKLRTGHLRGNHFTIRLHGVVDRAENYARDCIDQLAQTGFPNYFGPQRFGHQDRTLREGYELISGTKKPSRIPYNKRQFLLRMGLSAVQSALFNQALSDRIRDGLQSQVLPGDVLQVRASGGIFVSDSPEQDQPRLEQNEIALTGPIFGPKMKQPREEPLQREQGLLLRENIPFEWFSRFDNLTSGSRRPYLIIPGEIKLEPFSEVVPGEESSLDQRRGIELEFQLPPGVYATMLLRELQKSLFETEEESFQA